MATTSLHADREAFKELVALTADKFGYEQSHIEKDYWVSQFLREIATSEFKDKVYFKGGTSLSKAYGLIDRFSEDLDLFVFTGNVESSKQAEKTLNKKISEYIISHNKDMYKEEMSKRGGNFNMLCFSYDNMFEYLGLKEYLEVEIKSCDLTDKHRMFYPTDIRSIQPIVTTYLESIGRKDLISTYHIERFEIQCIDPTRTICDKISRLIRLSYEEDYTVQIVKYIRDIYDLTVILRKDKYKGFINSDDFLEGMLSVTMEDKQNKNYPSNISLADAMVFKNAKGLMRLSPISKAYTDDMKKLIFDKTRLPSVEDVVNTLEYIHARLQEVESLRI